MTKIERLPDTVGGINLDEDVFPLLEDSGNGEADVDGRDIDPLEVYAKELADLDLAA